MQRFIFEELAIMFETVTISAEENTAISSHVELSQLKVSPQFCFEELFLKSKI